MLTKDRQPPGDIKEQQASSIGYSDAQLQTLRYLLLGSDYQKLLKNGLTDGDHEALARRLAPVLSKTLDIAGKQDKQLEQVLNPLITRSLLSSISKNPTPVADALYPVMGPAIRKSISQSIEGLLNNFNTLLENSLSPRSMKWRFDAWRTGRPFSEVALLNTLEYQVEQVFLIHKRTGLPIRHMVSATAISKDPDLVSGMLTAIQDFIHDSFTTENDSGLDVLKLGRLTVLLEQGPHAVLACVVRGSVSQELQSLITEVLEDVHNNGVRSLKVFDGNTQQWEFLDGDLSRCLQSKRRTQKTGDSRGKTKSRISKRWMLLGALLPIIWLAFSTYQHRKEEQLIQSEITRLNRFFQREPGLVLTNIDYADGTYQLRGLADPLAIPPKLIAERAIGDKPVNLRFKPYQALEPGIVLKHIRKNLSVPANITLSVRGGELFASGTTSSTRLKNRLLVHGPLFSGVNSVNVNQLKTLPQDGQQVK